tara:strand:+ start:1971 stop:2243 length:273 start_codon:yes stop_codon:yes gene_type:complete
MDTKTIEHNELIAKRVPPGDRWSLINDPKKEVFNSLTETLESFHQQTKFKGEYRLAPLDSKLYVIKTTEEEIKIEQPKTFSLYGEFQQGI